MKKYIVDYFPYFDAIDKEKLELRIHILKDHVDKFVIAEANKTFSGNPINFNLKNTIKQLNLPEDKIDIIEVILPEDDDELIQDVDYINCYDGNHTNLNAVRARARERIQRDAINTVLDQYPDESIFIVSDSDEIINPTFISWFADIVADATDKLIKIPLVHLEGRADLRVYNTKTNQPKPWDRSMYMCTKKHLQTVTANTLRSNVYNPYEITYICQNGYRVEDAGWHFSWMGSKTDRQIKSQSFAHYDDTFDHLIGKGYKYTETKKIVDADPVEGGVSCSGEKDTILKKYPHEKLPQEIFSLERVRSNFLPSEVKFALTSNDKQTIVESIPVIGTAVVNCPFWVARLLMSVDYPVDNFVIFNNNARQEINEELDKIASIEHKYIKKVTVCHLPGNIGCAGAWNLIIKSYITSPYWIIVNNDVAFTPGLLSKFVDKKNDPNAGIIFAREGKFSVGDWDLFLIKDVAVKHYGLFDENLYPAYGEDVDYIMRLHLDKRYKSIFLDDAKYLHGETFEYEKSGSQTWRSEPELKEKIDAARFMNEHEYLNKKWGNGWRWVSPYLHPYNIENFPRDHLSYDIEFIRKKHLGF